jgi:hypothetical protein
MLDWTTRNNQGQLVRKERTRTLGNYRSPPSFTVHEGDIGSRDVVIVRVLRAFGTDSKLTFTTQQLPTPGSIRIFDQLGDQSQLVHLAQNRPEANEWLRTHRYPDAVLEEVLEDVSNTASTEQNCGREA